MAARRSASVQVTTPGGDEVRIDLEPGHTAQDIIAALIQGGHLAPEDSRGNVIQYEVFDDTMSMLPGNKALLDIGVSDGAHLRVKAGARVA